MRFEIIALLLVLVSIYIVDVSDIVFFVLLLLDINLRGSVDAVCIEAHDEAGGVAVSVLVDGILEKHFL